MLDKEGPTIFLATVAGVDAMVADVKAAIKGAIADKNMPLDERWYVFCNIPESLQTYKDYIQRLDFEKKYKPGYRGFDWSDHFDHRGHRQSWVDFVEEWAASYMIEAENYAYEDLGTTPSSLFTKPWEEFGLTAENLDELKEEILQAGYHGFVFDW